MNKELDRKELAKTAFEECCSAEMTVRYGIKRVRPFWNVESTQFMYVPAFHFTAVRDIRRYRYSAKANQRQNRSSAQLVPMSNLYPDF